MNKINGLDSLKEKGVIYARVSSINQVKDGHGIESQEILCRDLCNRYNIKIENIFYDKGVSGGNRNRNGLNSLITYLKKANKKTHTIKYLIVYDIDRIFRDVLGWLQIKEELDKLGVIIETVKEPNFNNMNKESKLISTIKMAVKEEERINNGIRVKECYRGRLLSGNWPFAQAPLGYKLSKTNIGGKTNSFCEIDENKFPIIQKALENFAIGIIDTPLEIYKFLKEKGIISNSYTNPKILHKSITFRLLDKERLYFYAGFILYEDYGIKTPIKGIHKPMISKETLNKILLKLNLRKKPEYKRKEIINNELPLRGLIVCGECKKKLTGGKSKSKTGKYHRYYNCINPNCSQNKKSIKRDDIHNGFKTILGKLTPKQEIINALKYIFHELLKEKNKDIEILQINNTNRLKEIEKEINNYILSIGKTANETLINGIEKRINELNEEKTLLEQLSINKEGIDKNSSNSFNNLLEIFKNPSKLFDIPNPEILQLMFKVIFNGKIGYTKNSGVRTPEFSVLIGFFNMLDDHGFHKWASRDSNPGPLA